MIGLLYKHWDLVPGKIAVSTDITSDITIMKATAVMKRPVSSMPQAAPVTAPARSPCLVCAVRSAAGSPVPGSRHTAAAPARVPSRRIMVMMIRICKPI